jgi:hypothetical protein
MRQLHEHKPSRHSFITGNVVVLSKRFPPRNASPGPYKVVAQLPEWDAITPGFGAQVGSAAPQELALEASFVLKPPLD